MIGRIIIDNVHPSTPTGGYPAKAVVGEVVLVSADIFKDGHDVLGAQVRWRPRTANGAGVSRGGKWTASPMRDLGNDGWEAAIEPTTLGPHEFLVEAWTDLYATWRHKVTAKLDAGQDVAVELAEGARLLEGRVRRLPAEERPRVRAALASLRGEGKRGRKSATPRGEAAPATAEERVAPALDPAVAELLTGPERSPDLSRSRPFPLWVDRERALAGAWYEVFPRSEGGLARTAKRLPAIAEMGFDIVYLPPVHPIGRTFRKGRGNTLVADADDPGSPWAIGGPEGGHTALHPKLGTFEEFHALVARAADLGMEVALDYALQCSPDHPWVTEHPEWFHHRPDGSIAYAENPPKKYQDIYPLNFDNDPEGIYAEVLRIVRLWMDHGVRIFRVDNPHTKPLRFWERLLGEIRGTDPDVLFLAEAFTRPAMMRTLAKIGFHQSYTYFTWRNRADELTAYMRELAGETAPYMRPNFFTNTPDILNEYLQHGGEAAFKIRAVLAAMLSPTWGIYSGYELCENVPIRPGSEEYMDSEKYQYRPRDWEAAARDGIGIADYITELNQIRRFHPALHRLRNLRFHAVDQPGLMCFSKRVANALPGPRDDTVLVVANLDPYQTREATVWLDMPALGVDREFIVTDELTGESYRWGHANYVRLDPATRPAHVFSVTPLQLSRTTQ